MDVQSITRMVYEPVNALSSQDVTSEGFNCTMCLGLTTCKWSSGFAWQNSPYLRAYRKWDDVCAAGYHRSVTDEKKMGQKTSRSISAKQLQQHMSSGAQLASKSDILGLSTLTDSAQSSSSVTRLRSLLSAGDGEMDGWNLVGSFFHRDF